MNPGEEETFTKDSIQALMSIYLHNISLLGKYISL